MIKTDSIRISCPDNEYIVIGDRVTGLITRYPGNFYNLRLFYNGDIVRNLQFGNYKEMYHWLIDHEETIMVMTVGVTEFLSRYLGPKKRWAVSMNF